MGSDFEDTFKKIAKKKNRPAASAAPTGPLYLGDTETGRQIATGTVREDPEEQEVQKSRIWNIRQIPAYRGHASKGRGTHGAVRKTGVHWRSGFKQTKT